LESCCSDLPFIWFAFLLACQASRAGEPVLRVVKTATYFTVFNDSATLQAGVLRPDRSARLEPGAPATELVSNSAVRSALMEWDVQLAPQQVKVIEARPAK